MIIRPAPNWFRMLFVWHGSVLPSIIPQLVFMALISVLAMLTDGRLFGEKIPLNAMPFTLCGVALAIFLGFRNSASYERFWEGRRLWGSVLISARALTSQVIAYAPDDPAVFDRSGFVQLLIAFVYAFKHQLRRTDATADLTRLLGPDNAAAMSSHLFSPIALLNEARCRLGGLKRSGALSESQLWLLDTQLNELGTAVGGCERIVATPIPFVYGVLLHRTVYAYCALLPFGLVDAISIATPLVCTFVSYTMIALEAIASEISQPFGIAPNHLALDAMTCNVERALLDLCNETVPPEIRPDARYQLT